MKIVVTGATGFLGSRIVAELEGSGSQVVGWSRRGRHGTEPVDLASRTAVAAALERCKPTGIVHAAGSTPHNTPAADVAWYSTNDLAWATNLVGAAADLGVARLVALGSASEYGVAPPPQRVGTARPPFSPYGIGRRTCTQAIIAARDAGIPGAVVLRAFTVYGPSQPNSMLLSTLLRAASRRSPAVVGRLDRVRDFVHVDDVARAVRLAVTVAHPPPVLNLGTGVGTSVGAVIALVESVTGRLIEYEVTDLRADDQTDLVADISTTRESLAWVPRIPLAGGLEALSAAWPEMA